MHVDEKLLRSNEILFLKGERMKCINCGAEIKSEYKICPFCGTTLQIVPDYSVYDEDDINVILESTKDIERQANKKAELTKEQKEERARAKAKALEEAKQRKTKITIIAVAVACVLLIVGGLVAKSAVDKSNATSFDHQMKEADAAMFKGDIETAEKYYLKALALAENNVNVRLELADLYIQKEDAVEAEKYLLEAIALDKENYDAYRMLYNLYKDADNTDAILKLKEGVTNNRILSIFSDYSVDSATISIPGGKYSNDIKITISAKKGIEIYYTLDGSDPRENGEKYKSAILISGAGMYTLRVVTKNELGVYSDVMKETYVIEYEAPSDPVVTPDGGVFTAATNVMIQVPAGCTAYYTWDGTDPTVESTKYVSPFLIPEGRNKLSVIIVNNETGLESGIYRGMFEYNPSTGANSNVDNDAETE